MKKFVFALVFAFLGLVVATNAQNPNSVVATAAITTPQYPGTFYAKAANGILTALPRTTFKVGMRGVSILVPPNAPLVAGSLIVKIDGSSDPASVVEISRLVKGKEKAAEVKLSDVGNRVFEVALKSLGEGDYVIGLKSANPLSTPEIFVFRVANNK